MTHFGFPFRLCLATLALLLAVAPARAQTATFTGNFGGACVGVDAGSPGGGIAIDPHSGNVVVAAPFFPQVCIFSPGGALLGVLTLDGSTPFPFQTPVGVAIDPDTGTIVVADAGNGETSYSGSVTVFDASGIVSATQLTLLGGDPGFDTPTGVAIDASNTATRGQIIVADPSINADTPALRAFDAINPADASATAYGGTPGSEQIADTDVAGPYAVAIDSTGNAWVADPFDEAVYELGPALTNPAYLSLPQPLGILTFPAPASLAFDPSNGDLAVSDSDLDTVFIFSRPGPSFQTSVLDGLRRSAPTLGAAGHSLARSATMPQRTARARPLNRARRPTHIARADTGLLVTLVTVAPILFTNGAEYIGIPGSTFGSTQGGRSFIEDPEFFPLIFPILFNGPNSIMAADEGFGPIQLFSLTFLAVPSLTAAASFGFAALLIAAALVRLRRRPGLRRP